jgi:hypothetical protein
MSEKQAPVSNREDQEYLDRLADERMQAAIVDSLTRYRRDDRIEPGDSLPDLPLTQLADGSEASLGALGRGRPLVLLFGSYT